MIGFYRVTGTLLATHSADCYHRGLDLTDVDHTALAVDRVVPAMDVTDAAATAAWQVAYDYATWRWETAPTVVAVPAPAGDGPGESEAAP